MHNLDKILNNIEADTKRRVKMLQEETDRRADEMIRENKQAIAEMEAEAGRQADKEKAAILSRSAAAIAMKGREILLAEKAALLEEVYHRAEEAIMALPTDEYVAFLAGLAAGAVTERVNTVRYLQETYQDEAFAGEVEAGYQLLLSAGDRERIGEAVLTAAREQIQSVLTDPPELQLSAEEAQISGGVVVRYGDTETTCSVPVILAGLRDTLDPAVMKLLFA